MTEAQKLAVIQKHGGQKENLLAILLELQDAAAAGCIDRPTAALVAQALGLAEVAVYEVAEFYAMLKTKPQARHVLKLCGSPPCRAAKAGAVAAILTEKLGVGPGTPTADGLFAWHYIPCVGACDIGPVIKLGDVVHGSLDEAAVTRLLDDLRAPAAL